VIDGPPRIVDFRFRVSTPEFDAAAAGAHEALWWNRRTPMWRPEVEPSAAPAAGPTLDDCVAWMRERGVLGVLPGRAMPGVHVPNDHLRELCTSHPGCFVALVGIDASQRRVAMDEIARCIALGFVGVHLEPGWLRPPMALDDRRLYPIYAQCEDLRAIVVAHVGPLAGPELAHTRPDALARVARDFPGLRIVMAHAAYPHVDAAIMTVFKHENVWLGPDPYHEFPGAEGYREWANRSDLVADRMLYGSSFGWPKAVDALARFERLGWRDDVIDRVLTRNALTLLDLPQ
jgi:predicted TIM-barrel fold metal-dependent hydrolase